MVQQVEVETHLIDEGLPFILAAIHGLSQDSQLLHHLTVVHHLSTHQGQEGNFDAWLLLWEALDLCLPFPEEHVAGCLHLKKDGTQSLNSFKDLPFIWTQECKGLFTSSTQSGAEIFTFLKLKLNNYF